MPETLRQAAVRSLGVFGPTFPEAVAALIKLLHEESTITGRTVAALQAVGPAAVDLLIEELKKDDLTVQSYVMAVLGSQRTRVGAAKAIPVLKQMADDPKGGLREQARQTIKHIESAPRPRPLMGESTK